MPEKPEARPEARRAFLKIARRPTGLKKSGNLDTLLQGFFLGICPKTQGRKNSNSRNFPPNSRIFDRKLKDFLAENSRNRQFRGKFGQNCSKIAKKLHILSKNLKNRSKLKAFPKTQDPKSQKTQEIGNSDNPMMPEKRLKKIPALRTCVVLPCFSSQIPQIIAPSFSR